MVHMTFVSTQTDPMSVLHRAPHGPESAVVRFQHLCCQPVASQDWSVPSHSARLSTLLQAAWNMSMVQTEDVLLAVQAVLTKAKPTFSKL